MDNHLHEAMVINKTRLGLYSSLTNGESENISRELIKAEKTSTLFALYFDWRAGYYHDRGLAVLCEDFVSMEKTPLFQPVTQNPRPFESFTPAPLEAVKLQMQQSYKVEGFLGVAKEAHLALESLSGFPTYNCMARHLLESIQRSALLAQGFTDQAAAGHLRSPRGLYWRYLRLQMFAFNKALDLDKKAAPLQSRGVAIICQDVPPIPEALEF